MPELDPIPSRGRVHRLTSLGWRLKIKIMGAGLGLVVAAFLAIQAVPYGHNHNNPPVGSEPNWDSPRTRDLAARACFACHSNETDWPWYSNIAPISWIVKGHVNSGRRILNFSEWDRPHRRIEQVASSILRGRMPPSYFTLLHGEGRLTQAERDDLERGLRATYAASNYIAGVR